MVFLSAFFFGVFMYQRIFSVFTHFFQHFHTEKRLTHHKCECDNNTAILMAEQPRFHARAKHIRVALHAVRDYLDQGEILIHYVPSQSNCADLLTKPLHKAAHERLIELVHMA